jgi:hypothetical protein
MDTTKLKEATPGGQALSGAKWRAKLIAADAWGSSAFYTSEALQRDGSRVFHKGLQMFQDHMTENEKWDRPEGSIQNLVGTLASDAEYDANGTDGPGLYADVEFYPSYVSRIAEIGKDVGLSVNAQGLTESGERDGRFGPILLALLDADSVDVVTRAGAGGKLTSILESDRGLAGTPIEKENQSMTDVTKEDFDGLVAKFDALPALFVDALKAAGIGAATTTPVETPVGTTTATATDTSTITDTVTEPTIDHAAIVEALRVESLPAEVVPAVIADIKAGKSVEDAVKAQTALREAFVKIAGEQGTVHLKESDGQPHGLSRSVTLLK